MVLILVGLLTVSVGLNAAAFSSEPKETTHNLTIMGTTDMHQNLMPYDYMADESVEDFGFAKTYTLIEEVREKKDNTLLLSDGDIISGSLIGTLEARVNPLQEGETQRIVEIYNQVGYEAVAVGNHELQDYKMEFFEKARQGAKFDWVSANIKLADDKDEPYAKP